jgi:hypothetical protein
VAVIAACVHGGPSVLRSTLEWRPIRAVGLVSYGLYLWHWPVFVLVDEQLLELSRWPLLAVQLAITVALTLASYFLVEMPVRRGAIGGRPALALVPVAVGAIVAGLLLVGSTLRSPVTAAEHASGLIVPPQPGQLRVLLVGDSTAQSLAPGLQANAARFDVALRVDADAGCAFDDQADAVLHHDWDPIGTRCDWATRWPALVAGYAPDVVLVMFGPLDVGDHRIGDRVLGYGGPAWRSRMEALVAGAGSDLGSGGAEVVFLLSPGLPLPEPVRPLNAVIRRAARDRGLGFFNLQPHANAGGRQYRWDGVHYTEAGADAVGRAVLRAITGARGPAD